MVTHSFFVSELLAERAVREYGVPSERVSVSPNATDDAFLEARVLKNQISRLDWRASRGCAGRLLAWSGTSATGWTLSLLLACA